jgi:hypothetical protein
MAGGAGSAKVAVTRTGGGNVAFSLGGLTLSASAPFDADGANAWSDATIDVGLDENADGASDASLLHGTAHAEVDTAGTFAFTPGGDWTVGTNFSASGGTATLTTTSYSVSTLPAVSGEKLVVTVTIGIKAIGGNSTATASVNADTM